MEGERETERDRERKINWVPPIGTPTEDQTHNLLAYGMMLQPTEPGLIAFLKATVSHIKHSLMTGVEFIKFTVRGLRKAGALWDEVGCRKS